MNKITKGPWKVEMIGNEHARIWGQENTFIAEVYRPHGTIFPTQFNANLIAAAPDMLKLLKQIQFYWVCEEPQNARHYLNKELNNLINNLG